MTDKIKRHEKNHDDIRQAVAKDYHRAVNRARSDSHGESKGESCCCKKPVPKGVVAKLAGYTDEELFALPEDAITHSFGCGNPLAFSEVKQGDVVLDLGCGAGIDLLLAARKVGAHGKVIGVDMTDAMVEKAKANLASANIHNAIVKKGIIEDLPVEDASVDWVISNCVINLSPHKEKVFSEIARVLRQNGKMIVSDIVAEFLPKEIIDHPELYSSCLSGAISEKDYIEGLKRAGMVDIEVRDRLFYDKEHLESFIVSELQGCCDENPGGCKCHRERLAKKWVDTLLGKVWSIRICASNSRASRD